MTPLIYLLLFKTSTFQTSYFNRIVKLWNYVCRLASPTSFCSPNAFQLFVRKLMYQYILYISLLKDASVNDHTKFRAVPSEKLKGKGRPPKYYHPFSKKEKTISSVVYRILPKSIADTVCHGGSKLAHLYGLPKTHKTPLAMRPILSASATYNCELAKWLESKLQPLSYNEFTVHDTL